jgi:hypothetical protein
VCFTRRLLLIAVLARLLAFRCGSARFKVNVRSH